MDKENFKGELELIKQIEDARSTGNFKTEYNLIGRLLNKYKKFLSKIDRMPIKPNFSEEQKKELVQKVNELIIVYRNFLKTAYKNAVKNLRGKKQLDENGELRRNYINYIEDEIIGLLNKSQLSVEEEKYLGVLQKEFPQLIDQYKKNLDTRAKDNLSQAGNNLVSTVIKLPKGCLLAIKKIEACVKDVRNAKTNKDKAMKIIEVTKSSVGLLAIPAIYLGKWAINSILLITIGSTLNLSNEKFKNFIDNIKRKFNDLKDDIKEGNLGKISPAVATSGKGR